MADNIEDVSDPGLDWLKGLPDSIKIIANSRRDLTGFDRLPLDFLDAGDCLELFYRFYDLERALRFSQKAVDILQRLFPNGHPNLTAGKRNLEGIKKEIEGKR